jgi:hypothetical protein
MRGKEMSRRLAAAHFGAMQHRDEIRRPCRDVMDE